MYIYIYIYKSIHVYIYIYIYIYIYKAETLTPKLPHPHPVLGSSFERPSGKIHFRKMLPRKIGLNFLRSPRLLHGPRGVRPYQLNCMVQTGKKNYEFETITMFAFDGKCATPFGAG